MEPYIKKLDSIGKFIVWIVDGSFIRKNLDIEFTNFGHYYSFKFIPKNELWIDYEYAPGEEQFYIDHMLTEYRLCAEGMKFNDALRIADKIEKKERMKSQLYKDALKKPKEINKRIHKMLLKKYSHKLKVWIVNGELVRDNYMIDFTEGGHDKVYSFVPYNEIWLDDDLRPKERKFVLLHELHERNLMVHNLDYCRAHRSASVLEHYYRNDPTKVDKKIKELI